MSTAQAILREVEAVIGQVKEEEIKETAAALQKAGRIFVVGEGRSGLMAKSFAMRLMHLGAKVYVAGETITPSVEAGDWLVAVSGSGTTRQVVWTAEKAKSIGCKVIAVTTDEASPLAQTAVKILRVPAATKHRRANEWKTIQPLGSLFDQSVHILLDAVCLEYGRLKEVNHDEAVRRHSNLES
ncbi:MULTISPECIES: 6-phospho-3-hexuloisomerase [Thermoactinomyces]|jgi:6-phospho-3-hexuloisomerase|uniref:6-phospho-3-hexuloisomerase n=1 Tax=Thermoactinomyces intermedius TaxID=2024 RepID=A0A8I1A3B5_THEIN|nr:MULTISPECIES: 6-phospho-3-hexuloisomerase [Thermoactinomyces]MBA4548016.1 6-phospho-3-hexuloisomerase [Thermoactinomyces intermedius]MBA4836348.1 6-phospho-3-hexuloisomerase [Thermoactinomyces intermedius]MBH8586010.1 6-phospho-3-hexuloisomerase [Thermoactinomyces sp. CICC 10520]MBH8593753.1 6-phospho-3-hexuloisomerase [Thermoactinomyces intermedius]MBH8599799.1 6-phospho-3-hexuloisomerase [Thermoactinomyces sp. CICC 23799]